MRVILPVAGASSRFPGVRPKWLLGHPNGNLMFREALAGLDLDFVDEIVIVCRRDHVERFDAAMVIERQMAMAPLAVAHRVVIVDPTRSQAETVAIACAELSGPIFVKDVDGWFPHSPSPGNFVVTLPVEASPGIDTASKSYVVADSTGTIREIAEKRVISDSFCVGGYGFADAAQLTSTYRRLEPAASGRELHLSDVIASMIDDGVDFVEQRTTAFADWGTLDDWRAFQRRYATIFVDLDGTIFESSGPFLPPRWGTTDALPGAVEACNALHDRGTVHLVLTTSRPESTRALTEAQLERAGLHYDQIVFGLPHAQRLLVNDYADTNPFPTAIAVNVERDSADLAVELSRIIGD